MEEMVIALRESGISCRETAEKLDIPEAKVWYVMRKFGKAGKYRARQKPRLKVPGIQELAEEFDYIGIEVTHRGTFVATLGDTSGDEKARVSDAIRDVYGAVMEETDEH